VIPGKVLISGEHSVVYGEPAIVAAVDKKMEITLEDSQKFKLISKIEDKMGLVRFALEKSGINPEKVKILITSDIPAGMGSSAALCAGVIKAAYDYKRIRLDRKLWHQLAWECEKKAHWNSSGVDPAAVINGGLLWYVRGKELEQLKIDHEYDTGRPEESTGEMVSGLAERMKMLDLRSEIVDQIGKVTKKIRKRMEEGGQIKNLINENGLLLEELGLVGEKAILMSNKLRALGYGVKITGAGGVKGGSGRLIVVGDSLKKIVDLGYAAFEVKVGGNE